AIAEPQRGELKNALKEYTADRVALLSREGRDQIDALLGKVSGLHERMWRSAIEATQGNAPLMSVVLPPINEVIDLHSVHFAMARRHLPIPIMTMLLGTAAISVGMIGFGNGRVGRRFSVLDAVYGVVLALALWMTIDLDYPGIGLIRVGNLLVVETLAAMRWVSGTAQASRPNAGWWNVDPLHEELLRRMCSFAQSIGELVTR